MGSRWDDEEDEELERGRSRSRREPEPEPEHEPTLGELIEGSVRKLVTGIVIAGALIGLGVYGSSRGDSSAEYQIVTSADGHIVYRVNTDSGSIVACLPRSSGNNPCWLMQRGNRHLEDEAPAENVSAAAPAPIQAQPATPPAVTARPAAPQLTTPQNTAAPAAR